MTQLSRGFFEQRYQRSLVHLHAENCSDKEQAKHDLNRDLNKELQRQMKVISYLFLFTCLAFQCYDAIGGAGATGMASSLSKETPAPQIPKKRYFGDLE